MYKLQQQEVQSEEEEQQQQQMSMLKLTTAYTHLFHLHSRSYAWDFIQISNIS